MEVVLVSMSGQGLVANMLLRDFRRQQREKSLSCPVLIQGKEEFLFNGEPVVAGEEITISFCEETPSPW